MRFLLAVASGSAFMAHAPRSGTVQVPRIQPTAAVLSGDDEPMVYSSELDKYFRGEIADLKAATVDLTSRILAVEKQETKAETQQNLLAIGELSAEDDVLTVRTPAPPTPRPTIPSLSGVESGKCGVCRRIPPL